jgi:hypothetical protein
MIEGGMVVQDAGNAKDILGAEKICGKIRIPVFGIGVAL